MSSIRKFDIIIYNVVESIFTDSFVPGLNRVGLAENAIDLTFDRSNVAGSQTRKDEMLLVKDKIIAGEIIPPSNF